MVEFQVLVKGDEFCVRGFFCMYQTMSYGNGYSYSPNLEIGAFHSLTLSCYIT